LAAFRRKPVEGANTLAKESETYVAFGGKDRVERLQIRRVLAPVRAPRYLHLYDLAFDGHFGTNFVLFYDFMVVMVRGKNLQGLVSALQLGAGVVLPRVRAALPLRRVIASAATAFNRSLSDARRLR